MSVDTSKVSRSVESACDKISELVMTENMTDNELQYFYQEIEAYCGIKFDEMNGKLRSGFEDR